MVRKFRELLPRLNVIRVLGGVLNPQPANSPNSCSVRVVDQAINRGLHKKRRRSWFARRYRSVVRLLASLFLIVSTESFRNLSLS